MRTKIVEKTSLFPLFSGRAAVIFLGSLFFLIFMPQKATEAKTVPSVVVKNKPQVILQNTKGVNLFIGIKPREYADAIHCHESGKFCAANLKNIYGQYPKYLLPEYLTDVFVEQINKSTPLFLEKDAHGFMPTVNVINDVSTRHCIDIEPGDDCPSKTVEDFENDPNNFSIRVLISVENNATILKINFFRPQCGPTSVDSTNTEIEKTIPLTRSVDEIKSDVDEISGLLGAFVDHLANNNSDVSNIFWCGKKN